MQTFNTKLGFTFIELVITLAILSIMASITMPLVQLNIQRSKEQKLAENLRKIRTAIDEYKTLSDEGRIKKNVDESGYPPSLEALVEGVEDIKDIKKRKIYLLRKIPQDPIYADKLDEANNWGIRSYQSTSDDPQEGDDVFDVYSLADGVGLNGEPYREW